MRKKLLATVLAMSMTVGLVGCGNGNRQAVESGNVSMTNEVEEVEIDGITYKKAKDITTDDIELTYFHFDQEETVKYLAERFMQIYPNIKVNPVYENVQTYNDTLNALIGDHNPPDVIMFSDCDYALSNFLLNDITELWNSDPETKEIASTINDCGLGMYGTERRWAVPVKFFPGVMYIDLNVLKTLNVEAPPRNWTWDQMIQLIRDCTVPDPSGGMQYFGMGFYNRLDSYYGIAAAQTVQGEFGFDGKQFDLGIWAVGEQQMADLQQGGYIAPVKETVAMETWMGDFEGWCGASSHVALFTEAFWTFQGTWNTESWDQYNMDIIPYVVPAVSKEDAESDHHSIATIDWGGLTTACEHPREAYELLKFMSFGQDGWKTRIQLYNDETQVNSNNLPLKNDVMPAPITTDEEVWDQYIDMFCKGMDDEHTGYWREYFDSCLQPIPYGWTAIAGYWNYCDEYFNSIGIHDKVDSGTAKAADFVDEATTKANYYHATAMLNYFGPSGYNVLSDDDLKYYEDMKANNAE